MPFKPEALKMNIQGYRVDVVFCIDGTGSMSSHMDDHLDEIKCMVSSFNKKIADAIEETGRTVDSLRAKVIVFRDFGIDDDALVASPFFSLPQEKDQFQDFLQNISAIGGGDEDENGLEALAEAMNSEWDHESGRHRHIIVMITNSGAHRLEDSDKSHAQYPKTAPSSFLELCEWWKKCTPNGSLKQSAKRLIIYAPNVDPWISISQCWDRCFFVPVEKNEFDFSEETQNQLFSIVKNAF